MQDKITYDNIIKAAPGNINGGIHPQEYKDISSESPPRELELPGEIVIPVQQHVGNTSEVIVKLGEEIKAGQLIAECAQGLGANIHSPYSGTVSKLGHANTGHPSGMPGSAVTIKVDSSQPDATKYLTNDWHNTSSSDLLEKIRQAGVVGLGGATFPTATKLQSTPIETLIVNAMECEPYITCDDVMLRHLSDEVIAGAQIAAKIVQAKKIIFATEDNKIIAINRLRDTIKQSQFEVPMEIVVTPTKYPSGGEKQVIEIVTKQQLPAGKLPSSIGLLVQNVATLHAVYLAVVKDETLCRRLVTVTGNLVSEPGNYWLGFGTKISSVAKQLKIDVTQCNGVIMGGPLMGQSITDFSAPVTKATNCLIFNSVEKQEKVWLTQATEHQACIRCGECDKACPVDLLPQQLYWFSQSEQWDNVENQGLFDCIECGACAYVCPSEIPLVHYYRYAKSNLRTIQKNNAIAEHAKKRFDFREMRLARAKAERALKHKKAAEARKKAAADKAQDPSGKQTAINAALERVKQKREAQEQQDGENN